MILRLASTMMLAIGVAVFAGSALAANGHGNGNGNGNGDGSATSVAVAESPGNSVNAPGQEKKDAEASEPAPESGPVSVEETAPAVADGVKPSNETDHETPAAASSDKTKKYGNGKTAGRIAMQNGAAPAAILHGPGNSQPHKVAPCSGGHEVDVHGLKGKGHRKACGTPSQPEGPKPGSVPDRGSSSSPSFDSQPAGSDPAGDSGSVTTDPGSSTPAGGVSANSGEPSSDGVLAAGAVVSQESLPFTGFPLWGVVLAALVLMMTGFSLRRRSRITQ